jgi:hypothetical protein
VCRAGHAEDDRGALHSLWSLPGAASRMAALRRSLMPPPPVRPCEPALLRSGRSYLQQPTHFRHRQRNYTAPFFPSAAVAVARVTSR